MTFSPYDDIGRMYGQRRHADHRLAAPLHAALGGATSVLNVGAGTGSYEPVAGRVVAVDPSAVMLAQRPRGAAPAVRARAEALPFPADAFDATLAVLTIHHFPADCADGFLGAFWRRPHAYLDPDVRGGMSSFTRVADVDSRLERLRADLASGAWERRHGALLECPELDIGYRLLLARCPVRRVI